MSKQLPRRIQRKRAKGWRMPDGAVYVGRPTRWGNPYIVERLGDILYGVFTYENGNKVLCDTFFDKSDAEKAAAARFRAYTFRLSNHDIEFLRGRDLACWCPLDRPCHADILLELANKEQR